MTSLTGTEGGARPLPPGSADPGLVRVHSVSENVSAWRAQQMSSAYINPRQSVTGRPLAHRPNNVGARTNRSPPIWTTGNGGFIAAVPLSERTREAVTWTVYIFVVRNGTVCSSQVQEDCTMHQCHLEPILDECCEAVTWPQAPLQKPVRLTPRRSLRPGRPPR